MIGQSPGATDATAAADITSEGAGEEQQAPAVPTRLGAILAEMELPAGVAEAAEAGSSEPVVSEETEDPPSPEAPARLAQPVKPAAEDQPVPNEWPESAKRRVAEEADKRRKRTDELKTTATERDQFKARVEELEKRQPVQVAPTGRDPLANVTDAQQLQQAATEYEELLEWATVNSDGIEDVRIGGTDEKPVTRDYSKEEIAQMRLHADRMLRKAIPAKANYLNIKSQIEPIARETYPELFEDGTEINEEYQLILQHCPEITRFADYQLWIGDAIYRRNERQAAEAAKAAAKGGGKPSPTVAALLLPKPPKVPGTPAVRTTAGSKEQGAAGSGRANGNDVVKEREQKVIDSGGDDADIEALVAATLDKGSGRRGPQPALV